ncbi:RsfA family transcriptional regulator [Allobacillus sp. GCM10007491]|uniref:RsfA family transcriptional regulator n=1 Tax=Allobacillus saliphilus TaxID=2912308 RepID=A0A941CTD9_9BACI|nr:RsfA family transcriptional regulator [Allobacillus saliphilus]
MVTRQDSWTKDEDLLLAETVIRYIREGKTQMKAFQEVANKLSRTPQACGFRWNANIRKQYSKAIALAKEDRKNLKSEPSSNKSFTKQGKDSTKKIESFDEVIGQLERLKGEYSQQPHNNGSIDSRVEELNKKLALYNQVLNEISEKIQSLKEQEK